MDVDEAMRWLVAAELARWLPASWRLSRWWPVDGTDECLLLHPHPLGDPVGVVLSRRGQLAVSGAAPGWRITGPS